MSDEACIDYFHMGPWPFYCGFTASPKRFRQEMERLSISPLPDFMGSTHADATVHYLTKDGCLTAVITMKKRKDVSTEQIAGMLAHEATHVAQEAWKQFGETEPGKEAEAYLVQYVVQCCMQIVFKTKRVRKTEP